MNYAEFSDNSSFWSEALEKELRRFLTSRLKCPETAADLTHDTYLQLDRKVKESPPDNARALAFYIALNLAIDYQRKEIFRKHFSSDQEFDSVVETATNSLLQPERTLIGQEQLTLLKKSIAELPLNCQTAFYLHSTEGLAYSEIAARIGVSKSMVNKLLSKAMTHCMIRLEK